MVYLNITEDVILSNGIFIDLLLLGVSLKKHIEWNRILIFKYKRIESSS